MGWAAIQRCAEACVLGCDDQGAGGGEGAVDQEAGGGGRDDLDGIQSGVQQLHQVGVQFGHPVRARESPRPRDPACSISTTFCGLRSLAVKPGQERPGAVVAIAKADVDARVGEEREHAGLHASLGQADADLARAGRAVAFWCFLSPTAFSFRGPPFPLGDWRLARGPPVSRPDFNAQKNRPPVEEAGAGKLVRLAWLCRHTTASRWPW